MWTRHSTNRIPDSLCYDSDVIIQTEYERYDGPYSAGRIDWSKNRGAETIARYQELEAEDGWTLYTASLKNACPVDPDVMVEIETMDVGTVGPRQASTFRWTYTGKKSDIVAYKIVTTPTRPVVKPGSTNQRLLLL